MIAHALMGIKYSDQNNETKFTKKHPHQYLRTIASVEPEGIIPSLNQSFGKEITWS
jgi:hypothetical protein